MENGEMENESLQLRSEGLVKIYGKRTVVNNVTFNVRQGEIVGLLGPNGAGKTTSFYMTTGLVLPNDGHIFLGDEEITDLPVYKRARLGIGYLAQEASVFRKMSVEDNIASVLEMTNKTKEEQREKLESLIIKILAIQEVSAAGTGRSILSSLFSKHGVIRQVHRTDNIRSILADSPALVKISFFHI